MDAHRFDDAPDRLPWWVAAPLILALAALAWGIIGVAAWLLLR